MCKIVIMERLAATYIFDPEMNAGKMIFLTGPRLIGKTTFARNWLRASGSGGTYFNWDDPAVLQEYRRNPFYFSNIVNEKFNGKPIPVVFDEIHKHRNWRDILKGFYDTSREKTRLLVIGSARLELHRKPGDSLMGQYCSYQMLPLGLPEATADVSNVVTEEISFTDGEALLDKIRKMNAEKARFSLKKLMAYGGFPEPFLKNSPKFHRRWLMDYKTLLTREDIRDLSRVPDIRRLEQLIDILPGKVGLPLSINGVREDMACHHNTISKWIDILKELYLVFTIHPWHQNLLRSIRKETKLYFVDWSLLADPAIRFENLIAVSLLRMAARFTETGAGLFEIMYIRDAMKRKVDFVLVKDGRPVALFEAKETDRSISPAGRYFSQKLDIPFYQVVHFCEKPEAFPGNCYIVPAANFLMLTG
jgi:uncharacterized protein